ncbi:haloalkane dehalogenase [Sphingomicrobium lutaoense]|uniref:Haloalkane dehalogenase n=1 Tax=Sphingomicrobium lutaoense TaxID=515949 RepID=A0A839Z7U1_9SPHN|nr:haloalkane dehalogenase [Sphingomicrobium lutaoense]MBB3764964.1 haloalkane dehalogenase [Sphingomicrobium lutaoense]
MTIFRTDEERFADVPDYPFAPHYFHVHLDGGEVARQHYLDEGPSEGPVILLLHGEPSWSFLYRHMIPPLVEAGNRVIAPDLIGFGKSDKPTRRSDYSYAAHAGWLGQLLDHLGLRDIGLFCQDWGGLLGLRHVGMNPQRFAFVVASNTFLPVGAGSPSDAFVAWREYATTNPAFNIGGVIQRATVRHLSDAEVAAYDAPFPNEESKAGARAFPALVPVARDDPGAQDNLTAWEGLSRYERPFLTLFTDEDPVTRGGERYFQEMVPGAAGQPHRIVEGAGHFCQEDAPEIFVEALLSLSAQRERS